MRLVSGALNQQKLFEKDVAWAENQRQRWLDSDRLAVEAGRVAVIYSSQPNYSDNRWLSPERQAALFEASARGVVERLHQAGREGKLLEASGAVLRQALRDEDVSEMVFIGHGSINSLLVPTEDRARGRHVDWLLLARRSNHLKRGVTSMTCGLFPTEMGKRNVPLPTFIVDRFSSVRAAPGRYAPYSIGPEEEAMFEPIFNDFEPITDQIGRLNALYASSVFLTKARDDRSVDIRRLTSQAAGLPQETKL